MKKIIALSISDFRLIFRSPSLRAFLALPLILFGVFIWFIPSMVDKYDFLTPYLSMFLMLGVIENTQLFCFLISMVLIDEKETDVAKVYAVVPLSKVQYILSRLLIPFLITVILNIVLIKIQTFYPVGWGVNFVISILTALVVPVYVLSINVLVKNRMQGMIYIKTFNILVLLPLAAFFLPEGYRHFFGILPTHWIFQTIEYTTQELPIWTVATIGFLYFGVLLVFASKQFIRKHFV